MSATLLPELASESIETADRLVRLSAKEGLDGDEMEYLLASGFSALQRVPRLWPLIRSRIGSGMTAATAHALLVRILDAVTSNLALAGLLKKHAREAAEAEEQLLDIRPRAAHLLEVLDAPARWPDEEQLKEAKKSMQRGERLTAEQFRQAQFGDLKPQHRGPAVR